MKLLITLIDWEYPEDGQVPQAELIDLDSISENELMLWYLTFANGVIVEMKATGDCEEAIQLIRGLALGAGSCRLLDFVEDEIKARLWLYEAGCECYRQGSGPQAGYIFLNPNPQPKVF